MTGLYDYLVVEVFQLEQSEWWNIIYL
jgi:hypothetical protein